MASLPAVRARLGGHVVVSGQDATAGAVMLLAAAVALPLAGHAAPGCPLRALTGVPCPLCGLSTGVAAAVRGHELSAAAANPVAPLLVAGAIAVLLARPAALRVPAAALALALLVAWPFELHRFGVL